MTEFAANRPLSLASRSGGGRRNASGPAATNRPAAAGFVLLGALAVAAWGAEPQKANRPGSLPATATAIPDGAPQQSAGSEDGLAEASIAAPRTEPPATAEIPVERQRYHVRVQIDMESAPQFGNEFRRRVVDAVRDGLERYVGQFWECEVSEEQGQFFTGPAALGRLRGDTLPREALPEDVHKVYLLSVSVHGGGFRIAGREWDLLTRQLGPVALALDYERRTLPDTALRVVRDLFRPTAAVEATKSGPIRLHARGGEYPPRDESWQPLAPGRIFETFYCILNKERAIERIQPVPFTYLAAEDDVVRGVGSATVTSGLRAPLMARRRVQPVALGINRRAPETRLRLITRPPARKLLAGAEVEISPVSHLDEGSAAPSGRADAAGRKATEKQAPAEEVHSPTRLPRLVADRNGMVSLSAGLSPAGQPVWLFVKSGQALLARVPIVPGAQSAETLELPDDTLRLDTEGSIALLQAKLVDAVARRAVLMSQAKARAKAGEWDAVTALLKQLDQMRKAPAFAVEINTIRIPALKAARSRRDRTTEARIQKLCDETTELVNNYLDEEKIKELREELTEMQQISADEATAEARAKSGASQPDRPQKKSAVSKKSPKSEKPVAEKAPGDPPAEPPTLPTSPVEPGGFKPEKTAAPKVSF